jgi:hypothetical protein
MAIFDQSMDLAGHKVDAGQQADGSEALIFMIAGEGRMHAGLRRQVRCRGGRRLDPWLLAIRDDRNRVAGLLLRCDRGFLEALDLAVNARHFRHLLFKFRVAALQVVTHFVRLDLLLIEDLAHRALDQLVEAGVVLRWPMLTRVTGQKPGRSQLVGISQILRLPAGQRHQPRFGLGGDLGLFPWPRMIVERHHRAVGQGPLNTPLNRLMMQSQSPSDGKERWIFAVTQQYTGSFNPARRFRPRPRNRYQLRHIRIPDRQLNHPPPCQRAHQRDRSTQNSRSLGPKHGRRVPVRCSTAS